MVDAYKERLAAAMKQAGVSVEALAKHLEVTPQAIKKILAGTSNALTSVNNAKAAKFLGVTSDWLAIGSEAGMQLQLSDEERAMVLAVRDRLRAKAGQTKDDLAGPREARGDHRARLVRPTRKTSPSKRRGAK